MKIQIGATSSTSMHLLKKKKRELWNKHPSGTSLGSCLISVQQRSLGFGWCMRTRADSLSFRWIPGGPEIFILPFSSILAHLSSLLLISTYNNFSIWTDHSLGFQHCKLFRRSLLIQVLRWNSKKVRSERTNKVDSTEKKWLSGSQLSSHWDWCGGSRL